MTPMLQRIAAAAACALLLACPASAQLIGSGHVMGNGTSSPAAPTDTALSAIMNQTGSGMASGVGAVLSHAPNASGGVATLGSTPVNGQCPQFNSAGAFISIVCPTGGGGGSGTVNAGTQGQAAAYNASGAAVVGVPLQCTPIEAWGGGVGVSNNATAYTAAVAAYGSGGGCVSFGPGTYNFTTAGNITYPTASFYSAAVRGAGADATILHFASGSNGFGFTMGATTHPSFHVSDLSLVTAGPGSGGSIAINATYLAAQNAYIVLSDINKVNIRPDNPDARVNYWGFAINTAGVSGVNISGVNIIGAQTPSSGAASGGLGVGWNINGDRALLSFGVLFNIHDSNIQSTNEGIIYGDCIQGLSVSNTNINFNTFGIVTGGVAACGANGLAGLEITNSYISNYNNDITFNAAVNSVQISNTNFIIFPNSTAVICNGCVSATFSADVFNCQGSNTLGLNLSSPSHAVSVSGNTYDGCAAAGNVVGSGVTGINFQSNTYVSTPAPISNSGTVLAGSCSGVIGGTCTAGATY